jgi:hypothetical protein
VPAVRLPLLPWPAQGPPVMNARLPSVAVWFCRCLSSRCVGKSVCHHSWGTFRPLPTTSEGIASY